MIADFSYDDYLVKKKKKSFTLKLTNKIRSWIPIHQFLTNSPSGQFLGLKCLYIPLPIKEFYLMWS